MHCSGFAAKVALEKVFGEGCVPAGTGTKIVVEGIAAADDRLSVSITE
jgi:7,8-dihydropterin-6-yl-methyl-4-(beta-D-ribofuranosyl)aminobenzene 5'-phosphate synthase